MPTTVSEIEKQINGLPYHDQLLLIERVAHRLRESESSVLEGQLVAMANDPEIQVELRRIEEDVSATEMDGLE